VNECEPLYAGDKMADSSGKEYVVLHENDILALM
jgi:co-chaperonin GroES (HSP10)